MTNNTNLFNLKQLLEVYDPKTKGILTEEEVKTIKENLEIESMDLLELYNLRDFVVLYLSSHDDHNLSDTMNKMSAITSVIDEVIFNKGGNII